MSKKKSTSTKTTHETATFRFLPFAVDLFERRDLKMQRSELLPVRAPQELTAQTLDVLGHVVRQGTMEGARDLSPGADVYALEAQWQAWWIASGRPVLRSPDKAFLGWVRKKTL